MENKKFSLNFKDGSKNKLNNNRMNSIDEFNDVPHYLDYDENDDRIIKTSRVGRDEMYGIDGFDLENYVDEEQDRLNNQNPYFDDSVEQEEHVNKAKPIIIVGFIILFLIIVIRALAIFLFKKDDKPSKDSADNENTSQVEDNKSNTTDKNNAMSKNMYGDGYFKIINKNANTYSAMDTMVILQNANSSIKQYLEEIKKLEKSNLETVKRKRKVDELQTLINKDFSTLETSAKVFDKYQDAGNALYNCIYDRFQNINTLLESIKFLNSGSQSVEKINNHIDIENEKLEGMSKLIIEFAKENDLQYKQEENSLRIND